MVGAITPLPNPHSPAPHAPQRSAPPPTRAFPLSSLKNEISTKRGNRGALTGESLPAEGGIVGEASRESGEQEQHGDLHVCGRAKSRARSGRVSVREIVRGDGANDTVADAAAAASV